jgi:hypothetical protein
MIYRVRGRLREAEAAEFHRKLADGTIAAQKPDGQEIVDSMGRAVVADGGEVVWSETCYCPTPLAHERETVLDRYFDAIATNEITDHETYPGRPFMAHLDELASKS